jgi:hypothetical protein
LESFPVCGGAACYFFRLGRCVRAEAAAVFAAALDFGFLSTFAAADAAFALVTSLFRAMSFRLLIIDSPQTGATQPPY